MPARSLLPKPPRNGRESLKAAYATLGLPMPPKKRDYRETRLHCAVVKHVRAVRTPGTVFLHPENEGKRTEAQKARAWALGMLNGAADLLFFRPGFIGALEFKIGSNDQSPEQEAFQRAWEAIGGHYAVVRSLDEALTVLRAWRVLRPDYSYVPSRRSQMPLPIEEVA